MFYSNLCARDWCAEHPDGTAAEFKHYYDHEISDDIRKVYLSIYSSEMLSSTLDVRRTLKGSKGDQSKGT
jgi:hypothetical protein